MPKQGFTLIEALTALFIFSIITITFYGVFTTGTRQIIESKNRLGAVAVANEKMEIIHNLEYDSVGTKKLNPDGVTYAYGIPAGDILEDEVVAVNNQTFSVHTFVQYVDDAFDGKASGTTPIDVIPNDYKRVKIEVSWGSGDVSQRVYLVTTFVPQGMEISSGGGTLSLNVIDAAGTGVSGASVHITNTSVSPNVNVTTSTDSTGNLILPGAEASSQSYRIEVSKNGYYGVTTYAPYPTTTYNPVDIHASVVADAFNQKTIVIDRSSDISIATKDVFGADFPDIDFHMLGGRKIGDTTGDPIEPVYSMDQDFDSGADGSVVVTDQSHGIYTLTLKDTARYQLLRLSEPDTSQNTFSVVDGVDKHVEATVVDKQVSAALVVVKEALSGVDTPIQNASVHLTNAALAYDATITTDQYGQAYFPEASPALAAGTYDYTVTMAGYGNQMGTIVITSGLQTQSVTMTVL
ncbi:MAG: prepilin-type N-terminal cleavage/methylation domain-containing protein [Candidatus Moranbacteria bacterium]|nr:prepilin-type N-terminal cleavage/methylation domain-containing protein [Candidatus Moranbacteria bacterium]